MTLLVVGRAFTAGLIVVAMLYAPLIERFGSLFQYFQTPLSYIVPPIVAVYLAGLFWRRATAASGFWAIVTGISLGIVLFILKEATDIWTSVGLPSVHFTYIALLMFLFTALVMTLISLAGKPPSAVTLKGLMFERADLGATPAGARSLDYRIPAAGLGLLMIGLILVFW